MKKRVMSLLLVMLMVFALLPAAAMAADVPTVEVEDGGVNITKTLSMQPNGTYSITLESWSTGSKHTETVTDALPTDIVLVLDQSGSMDDKIQSDPTEADKVASVSYNDVRNGEYYVKVDGQFYRLKTYYRDRWFDDDDYYIYYELGRDDVDLAYGHSSNISYTADNIYKASSHETTRLDALKTAVNSFLSVVAAQKDAAGNRVKHRVAIVGFASDGDIYNSDWFNEYKWENTEIFNGASQTQYNSSSIDTAASTALKETDADGLTTLGQSVAALDASGATCSDKGLKLAQKILDARSAADKASRGSAVLLFTDGRPGSGKGESNQETYAGYAVSAAYDLKHAEDYSAYVFTVGVFDEADTNKLNNTYTIRQYMQAVSSDFPDADELSDVKNKTVTPKYYQTADNTSALTEVFRTFAEEISVPTTEVTLNAESYLSDVINGSDFQVSSAGPATVTAQAVKFSDGSVDQTVTAGLIYNKTLTAPGEVKVSGFDYSTLYHIEDDAEHSGDKLVVTISGLVPTKSGSLQSNTSAGIFEKEGEQVASVNLPKSPSTSIAEEAVIIDYNYPVQLTNSLGLADDVRVNGGAFTTAGKSGTYTKSGTSLTYQLGTEVLNPNGEGRPGSTDLTKKYDVTIKSYEGADTALFFETGKTWKAVTTVPANTVYYDDAILNTAVAADAINGTGYNAGMTESEADDFAGKMVYYTFKGTGIDVYSTTTKTSKLVTAEILDANGNVFTNSKGEKYSMAMRNYSETDRLNVPSVFFRDLPYGEYTLTLYASNNANYKIDGIRVYNPAGTDAEANGLYEEIKEQNATFENFRKMLLANGSDLINESGKRLNGVGFFLDNNKLAPTLANYEVNGPKNEIYLAKNTGIAFKIENWQNLQTTYGTDIKLMVGLSVPDKNNTSSLVKLSDMVNGEATSKRQTVSSPVDMYYEVVPNAQGIVMIFNTGDNMVSLTNLKISGGTAPITASFAPTDASVLSVNEEAAEAVMNLVVDQDTLDYAANFASLRSTEEVAAEYEAQNFANMVRQLISDFITQLFNNIAKLFGK